MTTAEKKMCIDLIIRGTENYCHLCVYNETTECYLYEYCNVAPVVNIPTPEDNDELCLDGIVKFYERAEKDKGEQE